MSHIIIDMASDAYYMHEAENHVCKLVRHNVCPAATLLSCDMPISIFRPRASEQKLPISMWTAWSESRWESRKAHVPSSWRRDA